MDATTHHLIEALHAAPFKCVLAVTGGGTGAVAALLEVPGGSRTLLEAVVPYHEEALCQFLGKRPESFCSAATSRDMARRAFARARWLVPGERVVGLGCTASLATDRPKRGDHRLHITGQANDKVVTCSLTLSKGARERAQEEELLDAILLNLLAEMAAIDLRLEPALRPDEQIEHDVTTSADPLVRLLREEIAVVCMEPDGRLSSMPPKPQILLPGSFNPVHAGHWQLAATANHLLGKIVAFELSVANVDKPSLSVEEIRRRLAQFVWKAPVYLTRAPRYIEKAALFPGVIFVVGADTAERIVAPRYYQDSAARMAEALRSIRDQECRFLVAGRRDATGRFCCLENLDIPAEFRDLFTGIPESEFHVDVSSTKLRGY